jgi:cytochrome oxidase Cu insertion factor (SCO1/SenC/PrrC family)
VIIQGKIWAAPNDIIKITYYTTKFGSTIIGAKFINVSTNDGNFKAVIPNIDEPLYCTILSTKWGNLLLNDLLIEPGDSLMIETSVSVNEIASKRETPFMKISGRNADKNQVQHYLSFTDRYGTLFGTKPIILNSYSNLKDAYSDVERNYIAKKKYLDSLLSLPNISIDAAVCSELLFYLNLQKAGSLMAIYNNISDKVIGKTASVIAFNQLKEEYQLLIEPHVKKMITGQHFKFISPIFLEIAVKKTITDTRIKKETKGMIPAVDFLEQLNQWPLVCKQEVSVALLNYFYVYNYNVGDPTQMLSTIGSFVSKNHLKELIKKYERLYTTGNNVFPFELTGVDGKKVNIAAFKDKVVVLDFWFTGCRACILISKFLKNVKHQLNDRKDIVFISICVDKEKDRWLKSVEDEVYTHKDFINLYTNGEGQDHSLIKNYNIQAYPRLLIVGKNNTLFSSNPPWPTDINDVDKFIEELLVATK